MYLLVHSWGRIFAPAKPRCCMEPRPSMGVLKRSLRKNITAQLFIQNQVLEPRRVLRVEPPPSVAVLKWSLREGKVGKKNRKVCLTYNNILLWGVIVKRVYRICALFTRHFSFWGYRGLFLFIGKKEKATLIVLTCFKGLRLAQASSIGASLPKIL